MLACASLQPAARPLRRARPRPVPPRPGGRPRRHAARGPPAPGSPVREAGVHARGRGRHPDAHGPARSRLPGAARSLPHRGQGRHGGRSPGGKGGGALPQPVAGHAEPGGRVPSPERVRARESQARCRACDRRRAPGTGGGRRPGPGGRAPPEPGRADHRGASRPPGGRSVRGGWHRHVDRSRRAPSPGRQPGPRVRLVLRSRRRALRRPRGPGRRGVVHGLLVSAGGRVRRCRRLGHRSLPGRGRVLHGPGRLRRAPHGAQGVVGGRHRNAPEPG
jgi:translation initiation factor IF-2